MLVMTVPAKARTLAFPQIGGTAPSAAHAVSCAVVAAGSPEIERIDDLEGTRMTLFTAHLSPWRTAQFRRAP